MLKTSYLLSKIQPINRLKWKIRSFRLFIEGIIYILLSKTLKSKIRGTDNAEICYVNKIWHLSYLDMLPLFVYKNEQWNHVLHLDAILRSKRFCRRLNVIDNECIDNKCSFLDKRITINAKKKLNNWVYCILDHELGSSYLLSFDVILNSLFHEFQVAFRHQSITDRYRFRVTDNANLDFEVVGKGYFFHKVLSIPFSFAIGKWHNVKLVISSNKYQFLVDNEVVMTVSDRAVWHKHGGLAIIAYDWAGESDISLTIENLHIYGG